ncbi:methionine--tRNA ligase, mitochondrial isoform X1 [Halyomorpha halys]|uniref:methionine--tRNA ligase, mitochondrial isoform X1 n=1 Tax=Halyomorpha halys TaxID=286706 RepID=UPI0006D516DD|nr:methionine--tRNA ligase, mitochondrial isoform X1 [Halyomorpha halys]
MKLRLRLVPLDFLLIPFRSKSDFFISTPIFYVNASPHIGHLYSAVIADAAHRFNIILGNNSVFSTGTDEHGTKIQQAAASCNTPLSEYCQSISSKFKKLFKDCDINYSNYIRTSDSKHRYAVQTFWNTLSHRGYIYQDSYSGWYCDADEAFVPDNQVTKIVADGKEVPICADSGRPVHWVEEENYKFKLSLFQNEVRYWLEKEDSVRPEKFKRQIIRWIDEGIMSSDLSVSRPSKRVHWGIPVPNNPTQTIYVWLDALINYLTAVNYPDLYIWPPSVQVLGKDILKFHGIYWPAFLMACDLEPPKMLLVHSHWTVDGEKMSKSRGNVVCPFEASKLFTSSGLRYFLLREGTPHSDSNYSETKALRILNSELADTLGNLLNRCCALTINEKQEFPKFNETSFEKYSKDAASDLISSVNMLQDEVKRHYTDFNFYRGINLIISSLHLANKFFEESKPWKLRKCDKSSQHLECVLHLTMETLRICGIALLPIIPQISSLLLDKLSIPSSSRNWNNMSPSWITNTSHSVSLNADKVILYKKIQSSK